jgi:AmiR/NasT family two-component response regulator
MAASCECCYVTSESMRGPAGTFDLAALRLSQHSLAAVLDRVAAYVAGTLAGGRTVTVVARARYGRLASGSWPPPRPEHDDKTIPHLPAVIAALEEKRQTIARDFAVLTVGEAPNPVGAIVVSAAAASPLRPGELEKLGGVALSAEVVLDNATAFAAAENRAANLEAAMVNRAVIEQAKGVLMVRHQIDADEAFEMLRGFSQQAHLKVAALASLVVETVCSIHLEQSQAGEPPLPDESAMGL